MKHYTEKVRRGILTIEANMEIYASDKRDEGEKEEAESVTAALEWIRDKERQAKARKCSASGCVNAALDQGRGPSVCAAHDPGR